MTVSGLWVGSYGPAHRGAGEGISFLPLRADGSLGAPRLAARMESPSFLATANSTLCAVLEGASELRLLRDEGDGALTPLGSQPTAGASPCHLTVDAGTAIAACYRDGNLSVHALADGQPGPALQLAPIPGSGPFAKRQLGPHAHSTARIDGRVIVADLGTDLLVLRGPAPGFAVISSLHLGGGTGPRDIVPLGDGLLAILTELSCEVLLVRLSGDRLDLLTRLAIAEGPPAQPAGLSVSSDGRFLYAGIRGRDTIAIVRRTDTHLHPVAEIETGGQHSRHHLIHSGHLHCANAADHSITSFALDETTGIPTATGRLAIASPTCVVLAGARR